MKLSLSAVCLALVLSLPVFGQAKVWIVDSMNGPGTDFLDIQPAVDAAVDGDVILIRGHVGTSYGGAVITNRSLVLAGEFANSTPFPVLLRPFTGPILIEHLDADKRVTLRGLSIFDPLAVPSLLLSYLEVYRCEGQVFVEDVAITQGPGSLLGKALPPTFYSSDSELITLVHSSIVGSPSLQGGPGGHAVLLFGSQAVFHHSRLEGGDGSPISGFAPGAVVPAERGGDGIRVIGGELTLFASTVVGGRGGIGILSAMNCYPSADGGSGAYVRFNGQNSAILTEISSSIRGGFGGKSPGTNCPGGSDGAALVLSAQHTVASAPTNELLTNSPVREGEALELTFRASSASLAFVTIGVASAPLFDPVAFDGLVHVLPPSLVRLMGAVPASGELLRQFTINDLGLGVQAINVDMQAIMLVSDATGMRLSAANPSSVLLLDDAF